MKDKLLLILCFVILSLLCIVSCQAQPKQPEAVPETTSETAQEPESEPVEPDLDLEIAQNYSNTVVPAEYAINFVNKYHKLSWPDYLTYYDAVKALGSTGKNISDSTYHYEWVLDNGMYLHSKFSDTIEDNNELKPLKQCGGIVPAKAKCSPRITIYTLDPDLIKSNYPDYSTYLYESFFKEEFESYDEFFDWFGYKELPSVKEVEIPPFTPENVKIMEKRLQNRPVDKARAINIKPGMTMYEAINFVGSLGKSSGNYYHVWEINDNFFVQVAFNYESTGYAPLYSEVITSVAYHTANPYFVMYDNVRID